MAGGEWCTIFRWPLASARRWNPQGASRRRTACAIALNVGLATLSVALFVALAPDSNWHDVALLAAIAAIAVVAFQAEMRLKGQASPGFESAGTFFNAGIVLALLTLPLAGPLPALVVWWIPDAISRILLRREPIVSPGHVATLSGYALALLAGGAVLGDPGGAAVATAPLALLVAGLVMHAVNFTVTSLAFDPFYDSQRPLALIRSEFLGLLPALLPMLALALVTAALLPALGALALAPLAAVVVVPQLVLAAIVRRRSAGSLAPEQATRVYGLAIADVLRLPRIERRALAAASALPRREPAADLPDLERQLAEWTRVLGESLRPGGAESGAAYLLAARASERCDGSDWPDGLALLGPAPLGSRLLAVARAWAELTAAGTLELSHDEALARLRFRAEGELDPAVVAAAEQVVSEEEAFIRDPDFEPQLHRLPLPYTLRRRFAPALLQRLSPAA